MASQYSWKRTKAFCFDNSANFISALGVFFAGWTHLLLWTNFEQYKVEIFVFSCIVALTDWLDGFIARRWNIVTELGGHIDKIRDKIFIGLIFVWLIKELSVDVLLGDISLTMSFVLLIVLFDLAVEMLLIVNWIYCVLQKVESSAKKAGKIKMGLYFAAAMWWFFGFAFADSTGVLWKGYLGTEEIYLIFGLLLFVSFFFAIMSLVSYRIRLDEARQKRLAKKQSRPAKK